MATLRVSPQTETVQNREESVLQTRSRNRLFELDALRGIAACCVVWHHLILALPHGPERYWIAYSLLAGHQAVMLFFVLSGYVLSMPYWKGTQLPYGRYLVRRIFRIYVPYVGALLFAWAFATHFVFFQTPLSMWFYRTWQTPLTWKLFIGQMLMSQNPALNTAFWSLHFEMEMSIVFPFLCAALGRLPLRFATLLLLPLACIGIRVKLIEYMTFFLVGALLCRGARQITEWYGRTAKPTRVALAIAACVTYFVQLPARLPHAVEYSDMITACGAALVIVLSLHAEPFRRVLRHSVPEYFGRISYSLYLIHATVLYALMIALYGRIATPWIGLLLGVISLVISHVFCVLVEEPAMRAGKRLSGKPLLAGARTRPLM